MTTPKKITDKNNSVGQLVVSTQAESFGVTEVAIYRAAISDIIPLGLPNMLSGHAMAPSDRGDETQDRFRYQWAIGAILLAEGLSDETLKAIWCEHHDDFLLEKISGNYVAIQVKTDSSENAKIRLSSDDLLTSLKRFCQHESSYGDRIEGYQYCSNLPVYVPSSSTKKTENLVASPQHLVDACIKAKEIDLIDEPYKSKFISLANDRLEVSIYDLFKVLCKTSFRVGPPLRAYTDTLIAQVIPNIAGCSSLTNKKLQQICQELMRLVETSSGINSYGLAGALDFVMSNGRPSNNLRGKCITLDLVQETINQVKQDTFKYIGCGETLISNSVDSQKGVLHQKMRNAFLEGQFEPMWIRALSAESKLIEQAHIDPEGFELFARQLEGVILTECKDIEAFNALEPDERIRGLKIYQEVVTRLSEIAKEEPQKAQNEPKDTLIGIAGMLSGSCKFAWGVPLKRDDSHGT